MIMHNESLTACRDKKEFGGITDEQVEVIRETKPPVNASNNIHIERVYTIQTSTKHMQRICLITNLPHVDAESTMSYTLFVERNENGINNYQLQVNSSPKEYEAFNSLPKALHEIYRLTDCIEM